MFRFKLSEALYDTVIGNAKDKQMLKTNFTIYRYFAFFRSSFLFLKSVFAVSNWTSISLLSLFFGSNILYAQLHSISLYEVNQNWVWKTLVGTKNLTICKIILLSLYTWQCSCTTDLNLLFLYILWRHFYVWGCNSAATGIYVLKNI